MNKIGGGCLALVLVSMLMASIAAISIGGAALGYGWDWFYAPFKGQMEVRQQTVGNGDFQRQAYTHFYELCTSIQEQEASIDGLSVTIETTSNPQFREIMQTNLAAARIGRQQAILQYNQDSHKQWLEAQFKSAALPYEIPDRPYTGVRTRCAS